MVWLVTLDIFVHILLTVVVGWWLNKMAHREVEAASAKVMAGLLSQLPTFLGALNAASSNGSHRETISQ